MRNPPRPHSGDKQRSRRGGILMKFAQVSEGSAICVEMELRTAYSKSFSETKRMGLGTTASDGSWLAQLTAT